MSGSSKPRSFTLRGYRRVFSFERRLFRFDRWRIPYPHGVPLRGIGYFLVAELAIALCSRLPLVGLALLAPGRLFTFAALPLACAFGLMQLRVDGRPPHHVAASLLGYRLRSRCLGGLSACPDVGDLTMPLAQVQISYDAREPRPPVRGLVKGPATVEMRYPGSIQVEGAPAWVRGPARLGRARRLRVRLRYEARPLPRAKTIRVPRGRSLVIE